MTEPRQLPPPQDERSRELLEAALAYATRGWKVLPLHNPTDAAPCSCDDGAACDRSPGKHPRTRHGLKDATTNAAVIRQWWANWPHANVGILTGAESGFWALDIDTRKGGEDTLERLRSIHGGIPHTAQALTGGGGEHWLFRHGGGELVIPNTVEALGPGLDVRGDGGYIVAPPSLHPNGRLYAWEGSSDPQEVPLAEAPSWLLSLVRGRPTPVRAPLQLGGGEIEIPEGRRNRTLFELGCSMRRRGLSEGAIRAALLATNLESCRPPMDPAEIRTIAWSAAKYLPGDPVVVPGEATPRRRVEDWPAFPLDASNLALHGLAGDVVRTLDPYTEADPAALLAHFLAFFGNAAGAAAHFKIGGAEHPARIFAAIVGTSGLARKGTSEAEVRRLFKAVDPDWTKHRIAHGIASGEGLMRLVAQEKDGTPTDYRLLVVEPELANVLKAMGREGSILSGVIRKAWDSGDFEHRVSKSKDAIVVRGAHLSIVAHVTQGELVARLDSGEQSNGFANRFLWFLVRSTKMLPDAPQIPEPDFRRLTKALSYALEAARLTQELKRSPEAAELWRELYPHLRSERTGLLGAVTSRGEAQVLRLSLLYALLDGKTEVLPVHLQAGKALWDFSYECARRIFGTRLGNPLAQRIVDELRESDNGTLTRGELQEVLGRNVGARPLDEALILLEGLRFIDRFRPERAPGSKGRRPEAFRLLETLPEADFSGPPVTK